VMNGHAQNAQGPEFDFQSREQALGLRRGEVNLVAAFLASLPLPKNEDSP
jgi:hypothetical protein